MDLRCDLSDAFCKTINGLPMVWTTAGGYSWEHNDCGVIALSIGANIPYNMAHEILTIWGRKPKDGTPDWEGFIKKGPFKWRKVGRKVITLKNFIKKHPKGSYVVVFRPYAKRGADCHTGNVVDGRYYDLPYAVESPRALVKLAWECVGLQDWL